MACRSSLSLLVLYTDAILQHRLLLSEPNSFLDSDCELLIERLECLVRRQIKAVETEVKSAIASVLIGTCETYHVCDLGS